MRNRFGYNVHHRGYISAMSSNEDGQTDDSSATDEQEYGREEKEAAGIQLEGYTTVFDVKVALTPVELIPLTNIKK